jgi:hypothetical protein
MKQGTRTLIACIIIVVCAVFIVRRVMTPKQTASQNYAEFIGEKLGETALHVVAAPKKVVIIVDGGANSENPYAAGYVAGMRKTIGKASPSCVFTNDQVVVDFMAAQSGASSFNSHDLDRIEKDHADADMLVSVAGVPQTGVENAGTSNVPLVALAVYGGAVESAFRSGILRAAILPKAPTGEQPQPDVEGRFQREYEIRYPSGSP